ncbi:NAD-dependent epimerase/dehydratase family protein [Streptomyces sp. NBC_01304]|uniref:NAD-dependent epimerase/dehydratase family protein n=1 Tax=Streptomyces sp. NBC_01304 TaxID=2903818 RepID=UPI002E112A0E|nr:NAD(P)-dependent oxidoreductase [Streptomyces sp. NBC_01304]
MSDIQSTQKSQSQKILLAGASGVFGQHVARALTEAGHQVDALGRGAGNEVSADLMNRDALLRAVDGKAYDTVIHGATALRKPPMRHQDMHATNALRIDGMKNLVAAAQATGAGRLVVESIAIGYGYRDFGDHELVEDKDEFAPRGSAPKLEAHLAGMRIKEELAFGTEGIEGVSLRFGLFYGAGGTENLVKMLKGRKLPVTNDKGHVLPWINLSDAASATLAAVERGRAGRAYNIVDDSPMGFSAHVRAVAEAFGTPKPMTVPLWLMKPASYAHTMMNISLHVSNERAKQELGWSPQYASSADGLRALAQNAQNAQNRGNS